MPFEQISIPTPRETIIHELESQIIHGKLRPGEKLPTERELGAKTGVSKSVVHFALIELERLGFVTIVPRQGVYVADYSHKGNAETLIEILHLNGGRLNFKMSVELVELRNGIEGGALLRLAEAHTQADIDALRAVVRQLKDAREQDLDIPRYCAIESRFHFLVCELSGNDLFSLILNSFEPISDVLWQYCAMFWGIDGFIEHDEALIGMIERGEGHEARRFIEKIFGDFLDSYAKSL